MNERQVSRERFATLNDCNVVESCRIESPMPDRPLPLTKPPFSQPIGRHETRHSFTSHFLTAYDCFCGSVRALPMSRTLWCPERRLLDRDWQKPTLSLRQGLGRKPKSLCEHEELPYGLIPDVCTLVMLDPLFQSRLFCKRHYGHTFATWRLLELQRC